MAIDLKKLNQTQLNDLIQRAETRKQEINRENAGKVRAKLSALAKTWSGRGKRPRWFNAALSAGKKEKDLLI